MLRALIRWLRPEGDDRVSKPVRASAARTAPPKVPSPPTKAQDTSAAPGALTQGFWSEFTARTELLREHHRGHEMGRDAPAVLEAAAAPGPAEAIPQLPTATNELLAACNNPRASIERIAALFQRDPALAQALLRFANSTFYRTAKPCQSILDAAVRVGIAGMRTTLLGSSMQGLYCRPGGPYFPLAEAAWKHMVRTAPLARTLSPAFSVVPDEAFTVALLHDAGRLLLLDRVGSLRRKYRRDLVVSEEFVQLILDRLHPMLGALAVMRWGLGDGVASAIANHHLDEGLPRSPLAELLFVADRADRAQSEGKELPLADLWKQFKLGGSIENAERLLLAARSEEADAGSTATFALS